MFFKKAKKKIDKQKQKILLTGPSTLITSLMNLSMNLCTFTSVADGSFPEAGKILSAKRIMNLP